MLSDEYFQKINDLKKFEINKIKQNKINNTNIININKFNSLKIIENSENVYFLGEINKNCYARSIDDKELYIYDSVLNIKIRVGYQFSLETTSLFKLHDGNIIIVYSNCQKICIIDTQNIFKSMNQIYSFDNNNNNNIDIIKSENNKQKECIIKIIETKNKNLVQLSKNKISFYYNKDIDISNDYSQTYNYQKYYEREQFNDIINFAILEFDDNYVIVCSGIFSPLTDKIIYSNNCFLSFIKIIKKIKDNNDENNNSNSKNNNNDNYTYTIEEIKEKVNGLIVYNSVFEDNNILIKLTNDILGIGGKNIYLYSLKYKEIFQIVEIPSISPNDYYNSVSSFLLEKNKIIYVAIKYLKKKEPLIYDIKFFIYAFIDYDFLNKENPNELIFLSESKIDSSQFFFFFF